MTSKPQNDIQLVIAGLGVLAVLDNMQGRYRSPLELLEELKLYDRKN